MDTATTIIQSIINDIDDLIIDTQDTDKDSIIALYKAREYASIHLVAHLLDQIDALEKKRDADVTTVCEYKLTVPPSKPEERPKTYGRGTKHLFTGAILAAVRQDMLDNDSEVAGLSVIESLYVNEADRTEKDAVRLALRTATKLRDGGYLSLNGNTVSLTDKGVAEADRYFAKNR